MMNPNPDDSEEENDPYSYTPNYQEDFTQINNSTSQTFTSIPSEISKSSPMSSVSSFCNSDVDTIGKVTNKNLLPPTFSEDVGDNPLSRADMTHFGHPDFLHSNMPTMKLKRRDQQFTRTMNNSNDMRERTPKKEKPKTTSVLKPFPSSAEKARNRKQIDEGQKHRRVVSFPDNIIQSTRSQISTPVRHHRNLTAQSDDPALFSLLEITPTRSNGRVCIGSDVESCHSYTQSYHGLLSLSEGCEITDSPSRPQYSPKFHQSRKPNSPVRATTYPRPLKEINGVLKPSTLSSLGTLRQKGPESHSPLHNNSRNSCQGDDNPSRRKEGHQSKIKLEREDRQQDSTVATKSNKRKLWKKWSKRSLSNDSSTIDIEETDLEADVTFTSILSGLTSKPEEEGKKNRWWKLHRSTH